MTATIYRFPPRLRAVKVSPFIDPALVYLGDVMADAATADALFSLPYQPVVNVVTLRKPVYQPEGSK
jgi:hypothetical protein